MAFGPEQTSFTRDILGRYVCNTFGEAKASGPFDIVIIGGGTFGLTLAQDLFDRSRPLGTVPKPQLLRILVLEAGPFTFLEHVQDIPNLQIKNPGSVQADKTTLLDIPTAPRMLTPDNALPATRQELVGSKLDKQAAFEDWGLPWNSSIRFGGLAYTLGGRSLYFGGWSPRYLDTEMETAPGDPLKAGHAWPHTVVEDLKARYFVEAAQATGVSTSNDYINGDLHRFYRNKLAGMYGAIPNHIPLAELPDYPAEVPEDVSAGLKAEIAAGGPAFQQSLKLDAPLAVQILARPGFFPFNKFSSPPLGITAARQAYSDSPNSDATKRLMIVPNCHVKGLRTRTYTLATGATVQEIDGIFLHSIDTGDDFLDLSGTIQGNVNRRPVVVLAMGAIESARMALLTPGVATAPNGGLVGTNLMVHLRKNVTFTAPLPAAAGITDLELTALLVRCRTNIAGANAHFHLQITASAEPAVLPPGKGAGRSDALLFQNVPDLDNVRRLAQGQPGEVDVSIRAVGEILPNDPNAVTVPTVPADNDEYGVARATVALTPRTTPGAPTSDVERLLMQQMDTVIDHVANNLFGVLPGAPYPGAATVSPDGLGTTFHESGTLRMGEDPTRSVTNPDAQLHYATNLYAGDAAVLPTCGSSNPVMNGVALRRRLARRLVPEGDGGSLPKPFATYPVNKSAKNAVLPLWDGATFANWRMAGHGTFHIADGALQSVPSYDLGLLWCTTAMPTNYRLELEFFTRTFQTNSGVLLRFTNPDGAVNPDGTAYGNPAWWATYAGFEVQIDNVGAGQPVTGMAIHRTGAVYSVSYPGNPSDIAGFPPATPGDFVNPQNANVLGWNQYRIEVVNNVISVNLNGVDSARYTIPDPAVTPFPLPFHPTRGRFPANQPTFIGLQAHSTYSDTVAFRNIRATVL